VTGVSEAAPIALAHDAKGNLTQDDAGLVLSYDFNNQLRQAVVPSEASRGLVGTHTYRYDALGRRVAKVVDTDADNTPDTTTVFIYNARWQFIAEYAGGASPTSPTRSRVYSAGYIDEPLAQIEHTGTNAGTYYLHRDKQYCVIGLTDNSGAIVETYTYTPYGQRIVRDASFANPTTTSSYAQQLGHQGLLHDAETGLIYNRYRILEPVLGRWLQREFLGYVDGASLYQYVRGNPAFWIDPTGLQATVAPPAPVGSPPLPINTPTIMVTNYVDTATGNATGGYNTDGASGPIIGYYLGLPVYDPDAFTPMMPTCGTGNCNISSPGQPSDPISGDSQVERERQRELRTLIKAFKTMQRAHDAKDDECCLPCEPPVGSLSYRVDTGGKKGGHWPCIGVHLPASRAGQA
jgi:RHS repeat-associated protein